MKNLQIDLPSTITPGDIGDVTSVSWELAIYPDFKVTNYLLAQMFDSKTNITSLTIGIDETKLVNKRIYFRVKFHYGTERVSEWSQPQNFLVEDALLPEASALIETPSLESEVIYGEEISPEGFVQILSSAFRDYSGTSIHHSSIWTVKNDIGGILFDQEVTDVEGLRELKLPASLFVDNEVYNVNLTYVAKNAVISGEANYTLETYIDDGYLSAKLEAVPKAGKLLYVNVAPKTTKFKAANLYLEQADGTPINESLDQPTTTPKILIPPSVTVGDGFLIKSSLILEDETVTQKELVKVTTVEPNLLSEINPEATYKDVYSYMGTVVDDGLVVSSSEQLDDGLILLGNNLTKTISLYEVVNEQLVKVKDVLSIPSHEEVANMEFSVIKRYDGKLVINYIAKNNTLKSQESVFALYDYNPVTRELLLNDITRFMNTTGATARNRSHYVAPNNDIYFIPANEYDVDGNSIALSLYKLSATTFFISKVETLPFTAIKHVSIVPTADVNKFIILNGSTNEFIVDNRIVWRRENDAIYEYDSSTSTFTQLNVDLSTLPTELYSYQGYLRRDGKIILFNCSKTGSTVDNQNTIILDLESESVEILNNDLPDDLIYNTTVDLTNGEYIRISTSVESDHRVYRYVGDSLEVIIPPVIVDRDIDLVIPHGETETVEDLSLYRTIRMEGSATLVSLDPEYEGIYGSEVLFIAQDVDIDLSQFTFSQLIIIKEREVIIQDV